MTTNVKRTAIGFLLFTFGLGVQAFARKAKRNELRTLVETERAFSRTSEEKGIREAFSTFIADDGILFRPRAVKGKEWMRQHPLPPATTRPLLTWQPIFAAISQAGDLGYTTGPWQYKSDIKDAKPAAFGNFMTIWKKQPDDSWKFVLDLGVSHPSPKTTVSLWQPPTSPRPLALRRTDIRTARARLRKLDEEFSNTSTLRGSVEAFLAYAATDVRLFRENREPFVGKKSAATALMPLSVQWSWNPAFTDVSASGDLGYSYGTYQLRDRSSAKVVEEGNYARVWKKVGRVWKVVIDVANPLPPETKS